MLAEPTCNGTDAYKGGAFETLPADGYAFVCRGGDASKVPVGGMGVLNAAGKWCGAAAGCPQWVRGGGKGGACEGQGGGVCDSVRKGCSVNVNVVAASRKGARTGGVRETS